jgi:DNA-binding transcriptional LysR family regulator
MSSATPTPRSCDPLPKDIDYFCRHVLPELVAFHLAVTSGSKETAGRQLGKTPHAIGKSITRAEEVLAEWLGECPLIDPLHPRKNIPTEAGDLLIDFSEQALTLSKNLLTALRTLRENHQVRVATIHSSWLRYSRSIELAFKKEFPNGEITTQFFNDSHYIRDIEKAVRDGRADVGITSYPPMLIDPPLYVQSLKDQQMVLVFSSRYALLPKGTKVRLMDVLLADKKIKFVTYNRHLDIPANRKVEAYLVETGNKIGWEPEERDTGETISDLLDALLDQKKSNSFSILPRSAVLNEVEREHLKIYSLDPSPQVWRWGIIYRSPIFRPAIEYFVRSFVALQERD